MVDKTLQQDVAAARLAQLVEFMMSSLEAGAGVEKAWRRGHDYVIIAAMVDEDEDE